MSRQIDFSLPSSETLAGIYICVEGEEDVTVRPGQIKPEHVKSQPGDGMDNDSAQLTKPNEVKRGD